jgi:hypothetical protein
MVVDSDALSGNIHVGSGNRWVRSIAIGTAKGEVSAGVMNGMACDGMTGGGKGIRTLDTVARIHAFQACAFNRSATPSQGQGRRTIAMAGRLTGADLFTRLDTDKMRSPSSGPGFIAVQIGQACACR